MKIIKIYPRNFRKVVAIAAKLLKEGNVLVAPTDTVYGLLADALNKKSVDRLFKIKNRPKNKYVPIFIENLNSAKKITCFDPHIEKFLSKVWPGKLTVILKRKDNGLEIYGVSKRSIGLRIPKYRFILKLLKAVNRPLVGTSANISGKPESVRISDVLKQFKNRKYQPDFIISAGNLKYSRCSTIIDLTKKNFEIVREGDLKKEKIWKILKKQIKKFIN